MIRESPILTVLQDFRSRSKNFTHRRYAPILSLIRLFYHHIARGKKFLCIHSKNPKCNKLNDLFWEIDY